MNQVFDPIHYPDEPCAHPDESKDDNSVSSGDSSGNGKAVKRESSHASSVNSPIPRRVSITHGLPHPSDDESLGHDDLNEDDDDMAYAISNLMARNDGSVNELGSVLIERAVLIDSIKWLGSHLPGCALDDLSFHIASSFEVNQEKVKKIPRRNKRVEEETLTERIENWDLTEKPIDVWRPSSNSAHFFSAQGPFDRRSSNETIKHANIDDIWNEIRVPDTFFETPFATRYESALLFVDISGFTQLSSILDAEALSRTINSYFQMIVDIILASGGDVLKFAGDGVFAEWRAVSSDDNETLSKDRKPLSTDRWHGMDLKRCVGVAATCGAMIVAKCSNFPVFSFTNQTVKGEQVATLNVHCGLGAGELAALHVGNADRREFLIIGPPIEQVSMAERRAALGEFVVSPEAVNLLTDVMHLDESILEASPGDKLLLASRDNRFFKHKMLKKTKTKKKKTTSLIKPARHSDLVDFLCEGMGVSSLRYFQKLISLYVHPVVVMDEMAVTKKTSILGSKCEQERHRAEAELRNIYTIFIKPMITATLSHDIEKDNQLFKLLNNVMNLVCSVLNRFKGHLRQFIVDDKGVILIATFGLRGSSFPHMLQDRGIPAATIIHNALRTDYGLDSKIGATYGKAYCGVVGGVKRHEYAVLGKSVNLSARLMMSEVNPGILVDDDVRIKTEDTFIFRPLPAVFAKGYSSLVSIFEPLGTRKKKLERDFVGRSIEMDQILKSAENVLSEQKHSRLIFISGDVGSGKTSILAQGAKIIRQRLGARSISVHVTVSTSSEGDFLVPFSFYSSIFFGMVKNIFYRNTKDEESIYTLKSLDRDDMSYSTMSTASSTNALNAYYTLFVQICTEIKAPDEFIEIVGHDILGFPAVEGRPYERRKSDSVLNTVIYFMVELILHCTKSINLSVIVLDNFHFMDEMSWKVLQLLYEKAQNTLILCASPCLSSFQLTWSEEFWHLQQQNIDGRFCQIDLKPLNELEVTEMIARVCQCPIEKVDEQFSRDIYIQSAGSPLHARELLGSVKLFSFVATSESGKIGWKISPGAMDDSNNRSYSHFSNLGELIIHRLDNLEDSVRKTLQICAVLGEDFDVSDLLAVAEASYYSDRSIALNSLLEELQVLVNEDILEEAPNHIPEQGDRDLLAEDNSQDRCDTDFSMREATLLSIRYRFTHNTWKSSILNMLLVSRKREIHKKIAVAFEAREAVLKKKDYRSLMTLFTHWKESGERIKAGNIALDILNKMELVGFQNQSLKVISDAIGMWKSRTSVNETDEISPAIINELTEPDLVNLIQLLVFKGKTLANLHKTRESAKAYHYSLSIFQSCPASQHMKDRSIAFPIFSGLFLLLKYGIEKGKGMKYEEELVGNFISETKIHGDPVHYTRALAMLADMYGRFSQWQRALDTVSCLQEVYRVQEHSNSVSKYYGSDRCAQVISLSALWYLQTGSEKMAMSVCDDVVHNLMPKMEPRNVHNSIMILFPIMWVMKNDGRALEIKQVFDHYVFDRFHKYYGANSYTPCLYLYEPLRMLLDLSGHERDTDYKYPQHYVDFALDPSKFCFTDTMDLSMANAGRDASSIGAEICLLLAERVEDEKTKTELVRWGFRLAERSLRLTERKDGVVMFVIARLYSKPVYTRLLEMLLLLDQKAPVGFE